MKAATILLILLLATTAYAANATLSPATVYETTKAWQTLSVNNYKGSSVISKVSVSSPSLPITNASIYSGWTTTQTATLAEWKDGTIETNVKNAAFEFEVSAGTVADNVTVNVTASLDSTVSKLTITILNDYTPPSITGVTPSAYAKANNPSQQISAIVSDQETNVASVNYYYNNCLGGPDINVNLTRAGDTYTGTADFSAFDEGMKACYKIIAKNTPGETATVTGELIFDGTPPTVNIISPTTFATETTTFIFNASDNLASILSCEVLLGTITLTKVNVTNGTTVSTTQNITGFPEGSTSWSITCADGVGLTTSKAQAILVDTFPPSITIEYNPFLQRTVAKTFLATILDTIGLASANATFDGNEVPLSQSGDAFTGSIFSSTLGTKTLTLEATDDAGHIAVKTVDITVVPNHMLTLVLSPASANPGETITAFGSLTPDGNTTIDEIILKTPNANEIADLFNGTYSETFTAPNPGTYVITAEFTENGYTYKAEATLTITAVGSPTPETYYSSGIGAEAWRTSGYVKPEEQQEAQNSEGNSNQQTEEAPSQDPPAYEPLQPEPPRTGLTPKTTGIFDLSGTIKWLAVLLAFTLLVGIGTYAWNKRGKKDDDGIDWNGYFKND